MKVIDKTPDGGAPSVLDMHDHDAAHAVAVEPDRYEIVGPTVAERRAEVRSRMSVEQRVAALEAIIDEALAERDRHNEPQPEPEPEPAPVPEPAPEPVAQPEPAKAPPDDPPPSDPSPNEKVVA